MSNCMVHRDRLPEATRTYTLTHTHTHRTYKHRTERARDGAGGSSLPLFVFADGLLNAEQLVGEMKVHESGHDGYRRLGVRMRPIIG